MIEQELAAQQKGQAVESLLWPPMPSPPRATPSIQRVYGLSPQPSPGPTVPFAVVNLEIGNFDPQSPPEVYIYDDEAPIGSPAYFVLHWGAVSGDVKPTEATAMPLAPDPNPGNRSGHVPLARRSRIELRHWYLTNPVATAYVTLQAGVYVVPVYYTDIATTYNQTALAARYLAVTNAFWTVPTTCIENGDVNSIWHQADVQFHLVGNNSFLESSSNVVTATCTRSFPRHTVTTAVDLYGVETIDGGTSKKGYGQCRAQGFVAVLSSELNSNPLPLGNGELIAHEYGHYLGNLNESAGENLMNNANYPNVLAPDISQMRQLIAQKVYPNNPSNDYIKNQ